MKNLVCCMLLLLAAVSLQAQQKSVRGTVTDPSGLPVPGASVQIRNSSSGVMADNEGNFKLNAKKGDVLIVSATSFASQQVTVGDEEMINIKLSRAENQLSEVVVTAMGVQRQAKELGYATAKVKSSELIQAAPINLQNGLTGKVSGLNISTTNSGVFGTTRITSRGIRSLTGNNQPMLVLDGVPLALGYLNSINPNDIADVTILKSSSATAIYCPDGVNGAIIVTSKKGVKGKPVITISNTVQMERVSFMPKFQKEYGSGYTQSTTTGEGTFEAIEQQSWGDRFDGSMRQMGQTGPNGEQLILPYSYVKNGRKNFFTTGVTNQADISYSTGDFYLSAQNVSLKGTVPGDKNNRRAITLKADREYGRFKAGFNLRYTQSQYDVTTNYADIYYTVTGAPGQYDLSRFKNWRTDYFSSPDGYYTPYLDNWSKTPYFAKDNWRETGRTDDFFGNGELNFKAASWLNFTYRFGTSITNGDARRTRGAFTYSAYHSDSLRDAGTNNITAAVNTSSAYNTRLTSEVFITAKKEFNKFGVGALVGQSYRQSSTRFLSAGSNNLGTSTLLSIAARKGEPAVDVENTKTSLERYFGKLSFDYDGWAFLEATASYDIDSRLSPPSGNFKKSDIAYFYPGVSGSFLLHEVIPQIKMSSFLSYLKLRGAVSKTGNVNLSPYAFENVFNNSLFFPYGDVLGYEASTTTVANTYKPEFILNKEVGVEVSFLKNRINLEATYYTQDNTDQVIDVRMSNATGYTIARQNAASFVNKGWELDLRLTPLVKINDVDIDLKVNYTNQRNKVYKLIDGVTELGIGNFNYAIVGESAFKFKLTDYLRDDQGRVIVDRATGMPSQNPNLTMFGNTMPEHLLGINLGVRWKNIRFNAVADYRGGNQIVADQLGEFLDDNGISERSASYGRRAFIFPNSVYNDGTGKYVENKDVYTTNYGRLFYNTDLNTETHTNYLANGAFWKIREISLLYDIPAKLFGSRLSGIIKGATIGVNGRNLFTFLPKSNVWTDPEFSANGNNAYSGNAVGRSTAYNMPPTRIFGANITVIF